MNIIKAIFQALCTTIPVMFLSWVKAKSFWVQAMPVAMAGAVVGLGIFTFFYAIFIAIKTMKATLNHTAHLPSIVLGNIFINSKLLVELSIHP